MFRFRQFITEVEYIHGMPKRTNQLHQKYASIEDDNGNHILTKHFNNGPLKSIHYNGDKLIHLSTVKSTGHHIYSATNDWGSHKILAVNPKTAKVDMSVSGLQTKGPRGSILDIGLLTGREGSTLKAHKFYSHLINNHNMILHADSHSEGGMRVWQNLAKEKGVNVHGFHRGIPVNVVPTKQHPEDTHEPDWVDPTPEEEETRKMTLVAHKVKK